MSAETSFESPTATALDMVAANNSSDANETELVAQARDGSFAAIEELVGRYERRLFRLAQNITGNHEDAKECVYKGIQKPSRISRRVPLLYMACAHRRKRGLDENTKTA